MNASSCTKHIFVDHAYQLHRTRHRSCYWPTEDNLAVHTESEVAIKAEPPDEGLEFQSELAAQNIEVEEPVEGFFYKHGCENFEEDETMLNIDTLKSVRNECEDNSLNDNFFALNVVKQEIVKTESMKEFEDEAVNSGTFIKEEFEDQISNQSNSDNLGFSVIKQEVGFKTGDDCNEQIELRCLENDQLIVKDDISACVEEIIVTNLKGKLNLNGRFEKHKYDAPHTGEKPCKFHVVEHSGEKPSNLNEKHPRCNRKVADPTSDSTETHYGCSACNYKSPKKCVVFRHLKKHKKKILNKCNKCEYSSLDRRLFHQHLATHTKAFKCTKCKYRASRQQYLDVHLKTHVNSHYKCNECEYTATQRSTLTKHFNAVHLNV